MTTELLCDKKFLQFGIKERLSQAKLLTEHFYTSISGPRPGIIPSKYERITADDKHTQDSFRQAVGYLPMGRAVSNDCYSAYAALR